MHAVFKLAHLGGVLGGREQPWGKIRSDDRGVGLPGHLMTATKRSSGSKLECLSGEHEAMLVQQV